MKVTFEFNNENENFDQTELEEHYQASKMAMALDGITTQIRDWYKYDPRTLIPDEEIRDTILNIINDSGVNMERLGY